MHDDCCVGHTLRAETNVDLREAGFVDPNTHWYYQSKAAAVGAALKLAPGGIHKLLDIGSGSGFFAEYVVQNGISQSVVCVDPNYENLNSRHPNILLARELPIQEFDAIIMLDVLEHVEDDYALMREAVARLSRDGLMVMTVPAFQMLWSAHDVFLGHHRRYRLKQLETLAVDCGLKLVKGSYLFGTLFPIALVWRKCRKRDRTAQSDMQPLNNGLNSFLQWWFKQEHKVREQRWGGLTAMVVAVRQDELGSDASCE